MLFLVFLFKPLKPPEPRSGQPYLGQKVMGWTLQVGSAGRGGEGKKPVEGRAALPDRCFTGASAKSGLTAVTPRAPGEVLFKSIRVI